MSSLPKPPGRAPQRMDYRAPGAAPMRAKGFKNESLDPKVRLAVNAAKARKDKNQAVFSRKRFALEQKEGNKTTYLKSVENYDWMEEIITRTRQRTLAWEFIAAKNDDFIVGTMDMSNKQSPSLVAVYTLFKNGRMIRQYDSMYPSVRVVMQYGERRPNFTYANLDGYVLWFGEWQNTFLERTRQPLLPDVQNHPRTYVTTAHNYTQQDMSNIYTMIALAQRSIGSYIAGKLTAQIEDYDISQAKFNLATVGYVNSIQNNATDMLFVLYEKPDTNAVTMGSALFDSSDKSIYAIQTVEYEAGDEYEQHYEGADDPLREKGVYKYKKRAENSQATWTVMATLVYGKITLQRSVSDTSIMVVDSFHVPSITSDAVQFQAEMLGVAVAVYADAAIQAIYVRSKESRVKQWLSLRFDVPIEQEHQRADGVFVLANAHIMTALRNNNLMVASITAIGADWFKAFEVIRKANYKFIISAEKWITDKLYPK